MSILKYYNEINKTLKKIIETQSEKLEIASGIIKNVIKDKGTIFIFGCGHSHIIAEDSFYRAGGLANVSAIFDEDLMLHNGAVKSSAMERINGIASYILDGYEIGKNDVLFIVSSSGVNAVPIEMALYAKQKGIKTIGITSSSYFDEESRHISGKLFYQSVDFYIDNCVPKGDATIDVGKVKMGSVSTYASTFIMQGVLLNGAKQAYDDNVIPDIYMSGNVSGGSEYNQSLIEKHRTKIKHL